MSRYITLADALDLVPVSAATLRRAIRAGELAAYKPSGKLLIRPEDLDAWVEAGRVKSAPMVRPRRETDRDRFLRKVNERRQEAA